MTEQDAEQAVFRPQRTGRDVLSGLVADHESGHNQSCVERMPQVVIGHVAGQVTPVFTCKQAADEGEAGVKQFTVEAPGAETFFENAIRGIGNRLVVADRHGIRRIKQ